MFGVGQLHYPSAVCNFSSRRLGEEHIACRSHAKEHIAFFSCQFLIESTAGKSMEQLTFPANSWVSVLGDVLELFTFAFHGRLHLPTESAVLQFSSLFRSV